MCAVINCKYELKSARKANRSVQNIIVSILNLLHVLDDWKEWPYEAKAYGKWELYIPPHIDGSSRIPHLSDLQVTR